MFILFPQEEHFWACRFSTSTLCQQSDRNDGHNEGFLQTAKDTTDLIARA